jgi:hypothetical protein
MTHGTARVHRCQTAAKAQRWSLTRTPTQADPFRPLADVSRSFGREHILAKERLFRSTTPVRAGPPHLRVSQLCSLPEVPTCVAWPPGASLMSTKQPFPATQSTAHVRRAVLSRCVSANDWVLLYFIRTLDFKSDPPRGGAPTRKCLHRRISSSGGNQCCQCRKLRLCQTKLPRPASPLPSPWRPPYVESSQSRPSRNR